MKRITLLLVVLLMVGVSLFATDGQWTEIEDGYMIEYESGEKVWTAFYDMIDGATILQEDSQLRIPRDIGYKIVVRMSNYSTMVWVYEGLYVSIFIIERK